MADSPEAGATARRMLLAAHLRRLREAQGVSREDAGWEIRASEARISRMEGGRARLRERDVADLLALYGVDDDEERRLLLAATRESGTRGWWHRQGDVLPNSGYSYLSVEASAASIRSFEARSIPRLLQTERYAEAAIAVNGPELPRVRIGRHVARQLQHQEILLAEQPPQYSVVIDESAILRPVGGYDVLREQIEALLDATKLPSVRIQVLPLRASEYVDPPGSFTVLGFLEPDLPDLVVVPELTSVIYLDDPHNLDQYNGLLERLRAEAEPVEVTTEVFELALRRIDSSNHGHDPAHERRRSSRKRQPLYSPSAVDLVRADLLGNSFHKAMSLARRGETLVAWFGNEGTADPDPHNPAGPLPSISTEAYLDIDDSEVARRVFDAVDDLAELLGYDGPVDQETLARVSGITGSCRLDHLTFS